MPAATVQAKWIRAPEVHAGSTPVVWQRLVNPYTGSNIVQADISSIAFVVVDSEATGTAVHSGTIDKSTAIFDTLQTWKRDGVGHNFKFQVEAASFPLPRKNYLYQLTFNMTAGGVQYITFLFPTLNVFPTS